MKDLKIYIQDHGVYGCIIAVASSEQEARKIMESSYNYHKSQDVKENEIKDGFFHVNLGDS